MLLVFVKHEGFVDVCTKATSQERSYLQSQVDYIQLHVHCFCTYISEYVVFLVYNIGLYNYNLAVM